jgi:hypothetical protein
VEFELSNNYTGELEFPWCDPEQIWRHIRLMAELGAYGGVGRLVNSRSVDAVTIFDTPNEIMVWAFSRFLNNPGRTLKNPQDVWWHDYDVFDCSVWTDWAKLRFGEKAAPQVVNLLRGNSELVAMTLNICGAHFWYRLMSQGSIQRILDPFMREIIQAIKRCGTEYALAEKAEAGRMIADGLGRIKELRPVLSVEGYKNLQGAYERARDILAVYESSTAGIVAAMRGDQGALRQATGKLRAAAKECENRYGADFHEAMPVGALAGADYLDRLPERMEEVMGSKGS